MPGFLHYNTLTVRKPHGLKIVIVRLGFEVMRERKKPGWDPRRPSKSMPGTPLLNQERLVIEDRQQPSYWNNAQDRVAKRLPSFRAAVQSTLCWQISQSDMKLSHI